MIEAYLQEKASIIQERLALYLDGWDGIPDRLRESMRYSLLAGGKRIRPIFVLATVEALGQDEELAYPFACAIEMIHTYSLIHDDLPCMDDDDFRRGKPTNHKKFDEATAVLAGDALLTEAFGLLAEGGQTAGLDAQTALSIVAEGAQLTGARGMVGGQMVDLLSENKAITIEQLKEIHQHKTGDLIAFSVRTGARVGQASPTVLSALSTFAYKVGLAFQIQDDILDVVGDPSLIGKPVGSDEGNHKATYPALLGMEQSQRLLEKYTHEAKQALFDLEDLQPARLWEIADYLLTRQK